MDTKFTESKINQIKARMLWINEKSKASIEEINKTHPIIYLNENQENVIKYPDGRIELFKINNNSIL